MKKYPRNLQPSHPKANDKDGPETIYCLSNIDHEGHNRDEENQVIGDSGGRMNKT